MEAQQKVLMRHATIDGLTGLINRRHFLEMIGQRPGESGVMLLLMDVDDFKRVNDTYGHAGGDLILEGFASVLRENIGE